MGAFHHGFCCLVAALVCAIQNFKYSNVETIFMIILTPRSRFLPFILHLGTYLNETRILSVSFI